MKRTFADSAEATASGAGGTAKDSQTPFFRRHLEQDLGDQMIYREAYTPYAADDVIERLTGWGLHPDRESAPQPGRIVFVYRATAVAHPEAA